jgi:hypothetical protein
MDMGMKGDQITEGLHKQDISGFAPGRDLFVEKFSSYDNKKTTDSILKNMVNIIK